MTLLKELEYIREMALCASEVQDKEARDALVQEIMNSCIRIKRYK